MEILNSYLTIIEDSFRENRSQLKLINYGTGTGKTYSLFHALYETIKSHPTTQVIGVYVAPLREHLKIPDSLKSKFPEIPTYIIYSEEMKTTDEFVNLYEQWIQSILGDKGFWNISSKEYTKEQVQENKKGLANALNLIKNIKNFKMINFGDEKHRKLIESIIQKTIWNLNELIEEFLEFLIRCKRDETTWSNECLKLVEIFFPLHLLREKSGIILLTYKKFETPLPYFKFNGEKWIKKSLKSHQYVIKNTSDSKKFIIAFDEQEDGYQIILKEKIDIIAPEELAINNALSSIIREFSALFSTKSEENIKLLKFIGRNSGALHEFEEYVEKRKPVDPKFQEYAQIYQRLIAEEDNSVYFLEKLTKINKGFEQALAEIAKIFADRNEEKHVPLDFGILSRVFSKFENNRSLLIPYEVYHKLKNDLTNIFSYNNLYIYNIEPLKGLFLTRSSSGHVQITEQSVSDNTSVAELIYAILATRPQIESIKKFLTNVLDAEDSQSHSLEIWSRQISKVQKDSEKNRLQNKKQDYLNRVYVYQSYKSIINIKDISRYQAASNNLINYKSREVSIGSTAILTSPEQKISSMIANNSNVIFLISATGGICGDLSTSYDMVYLRDSLLDKSGQSSFKKMTRAEISYCQEIRHRRHEIRQVIVNFFNKNLTSCPNIKTQEVVELFEDMVLKNFINSLTNKGGWLGVYKKRELKNFIRFLFYLFEDDAIQETMAFTQTLRLIKALIQYGEMGHAIDFVFEASSEHPNVYYVKLNHKKYRSNIQIKLILYDASFNRRYYDKTVQKTYLDELIEKEGQKIFFISAYQSASKGLNPIIKTQDGTEKDFDSLVLLMDSYYTVMKPKVRAKKSTAVDIEEIEEPILSKTLYHFALMKSIVKIGDTRLKIKDFTKYLDQPEASEFREQQHQILLGKGTLQAIGRTERRNFAGQVVKIFINDETRKNLVDFYRYLDSEEHDEIDKLSVNNYEVYLRVQEEETKLAIQDYDEHVYHEIEASQAIQKFQQKMLDEIDKFHLNQNTFAITKAWDTLRDPIAFKDPAIYLEKLKKTGLFRDDFIASLFYTPHQPGFMPYVIKDEKFWIISDSINGERVYSYQKQLYPEHLRASDRESDSEILPLNSTTDLIYKLYSKLIPQPEIFDTYIPRPHFFYDILYPSLAENFVERWIQDVIFSGKDWQAIKSFYGFERLQDFKKYNKLYELFDLYYIKEGCLFCIDVKAWSDVSGNRLSIKTVEKTKNKLKEIVSNYPEFSKVKGLLLNLHAAQERTQKISSTLFSGTLIFFDDHYPVASEILEKFLLKEI